MPDVPVAVRPSAHVVDRAGLRVLTLVERDEPVGRLIALAVSET